MRLLLLAPILLTAVAFFLLTRPAWAREDTPSEEVEDALAIGDPWVDLSEFEDGSPSSPKPNRRRLVPHSARLEAPLAHGPTYIGLSLTYDQSPYVGERWAAMALFGMPLERVLHPSASTPLTEQATLPKAPPPTSSQAPSSPAPIRTGSSTTTSQRRARSPFAQLARACIAAALRAAHLQTDDARIDEMASRARWSGLLPELRVRASQRLDDRSQTDYAYADPRYVGTAGSSLWLEARLSWSLDKLLYADQEPTFERLRLDRLDAREKIASRVLQALFRWHRAMAALQSSPTDSVDEAEAQIHAADAEATLDVLTDGWFSAWRATQADGQ